MPAYFAEGPILKFGLTPATDPLLTILLLFVCLLLISIQG
jgi:hypothetical protein